MNANYNNYFFNLCFCVCYYFVQTHKLLLAATSDYFRVMFSGPMIESKENFVDLKGLSAEAVEHIVGFMYSGELELTNDNLCEVLNAASHLQVRLALDLCSDYIISLLNFINAELFLRIADVYHLIRVKDYYHVMVLEQFESFTQTENFLLLPSDLLLQYLSDNRLCVRSELYVLENVIRWLRYDERRLPHGSSLLAAVRFGLMSLPQLEQLAREQSYLLAPPLNALNYISEGMQYHREMAKGHPCLNNAIVRSNTQSLVMIYQGSSYRPLELLACNWSEKKFFQLKSDNSCSRDCRVTSVDNFIYMNRVIDCGGGVLVTSLLRFDPRHLKLIDLLPCHTVRLDAAIATVNHFIYLLGGCTETGISLDSIECYDVERNIWSNIDTVMPMSVYASAACAYKKLIFLSGGISDEDRQPCDLMMCFDIITSLCEMRAPMNYSRRLHEMLAIGESLYVVGGIGQHSFHQQSQIPMESYNVATNQWTLLTTTLVGRSVGHFITLNGQIISLGREHPEAADNDLWVYDKNADKWQRSFKIPKRGGLASCACAYAYINFTDEIINRLIIKDSAQ